MSEMIEPVAHTGLVAEAITNQWGDRCVEHQTGCPCCDAWAEFDGLTTQLSAVEKAAHGRLELVSELLKQIGGLATANVAVEAMVRDLREANRTLHRRCQQAEGRLQRAQTWIDMRAARHESLRSTPYVRHEMEHFYLRHILSELSRPGAALRTPAEASS